ncbi:MAG: hypothetical protein R2725_02170 [Solirubrobacterales bacterium]
MGRYTGPWRSSGGARASPRPRGQLLGKTSLERCEHLNEDLADALLEMAQAPGGSPEAAPELRRAP